MDSPFFNAGNRLAGQVVAAYIHDQVEIGSGVWIELLGVLRDNVDATRPHSGDCFPGHFACGSEAGTAGLEDMRAEVAGKTFRHLATATVAYTTRNEPASSYQFTEEEPVDGAVLRELGVERGRQMPALFDEHGVTAHGG